MPYFAPPGGSLTAEVAQDLQRQSMSGLGIPTSINVRMPRAVPAAIGAARRARLRIPRDDRRNAVMTGMGMVMTSPNTVRPPHVHAIPPPVVFRTAQLSGLGAIAHPVAHAPFLRAPAQVLGPGGVRTAAMISAPGFTVHRADVLTRPGQTTSIRRQSAIFMSPGGGYSQVPGFMPASLPRIRGFTGLGQDTPPDVGSGTIPLSPLSPLLDPTQNAQPANPGIDVGVLPLTSPSWTSPLSPLPQGASVPPSTPLAVTNIPISARPAPVAMIGPPGTPGQAAPPSVASILQSPILLIAVAAGGVLLLSGGKGRRRR